MDDDYAGSLDDAELLEKLAENLDDYFHLLVRKYQKTIFGVAWKMVDSPEDAEEAAADTFVKAYYALPEMIRKGRDIRLQPWLVRIVKNNCRNRRRHERQLKRPPPGISLDQQGARELVESTPYYQISSAEEVVVQQESDDELHRLLDHLLGQLPELQRKIMNLRYFQELSCIRIAKELREKPDTIKKARLRALKKLRTMISRTKSGDQ
jgi:RNA polymerase sigma-70 factor, ECF subfamily